MSKKHFILALILFQAMLMSQWSDPAYSKITQSDQESERYKLMDKIRFNQY